MPGISDDANTAFVGPYLDSDFRWSAERPLNGFQYIRCLDLLGALQQIPTEKEESKHSIQHQRFGSLKVR
jgi:hypothetical protein